MGKALFQKRAVRHDGAGQIGKVFLPEKGQGDFPQPFREGDPPHTAFHIRCEVGGVILEVGGEKNQPHAQDAAGKIKNSVAAGSAVHQIADEFV